MKQYDIGKAGVKILDMIRQDKEDREAEIEAKDAEIARLRAILSPLLAHAASHDYAPPLKFSVQQCRDIKEKVNGI